MQAIVYPKTDGGVAVIVPAPDWDIRDVALKDVPNGVPYVLCELSEIPTDRTERDAWTADFSNPHGYGRGAEWWFSQVVAKAIEDEKGETP